jgi:small subunit ribosomal protein S6
VKRPYESAVVFDGTLPDAALEKERVAVENFLKQNSTFDKTEIWGKRKMAYPIRKKQSGYYCLFLYNGDQETIRGLESRFKLNESVLRYLSVKQNQNAKTVALEMDLTAPRVSDEAINEDRDKDDM